MPHPRYFLPLLVLPCCGLVEAASVPLAPHQQAPREVRKVVLPNGIADAGGRRGFFTNVRGGIDAVDLITGELLWETIEAEVPLQVVDDQLVAQAGTRRNRLRILIFDLARRGQCVFESDPVIFPDWVVTGEAPGHSFLSRWRLEQSRLVLDWEARAWPAHKMRLSEAKAAPVRQGGGQAVIDLGNGQVRMTAQAALAPAPPCAYMDLLQGLAVRWHGEVGGQIKAVALMDAPGEKETPQPADSKVADKKAEALSALESWREAASEDPDAGGPKKTVRKEKLVLYSWDAGTHKLLSTHTLCVGQRFQVRATLDKQHLCVRQADPGPSEGDTRGPRNDPWQIFDLNTGAQHGRIPHESGMTSVVLLGRRACYTVPEPIRGGLDELVRQQRALKMIDLHSGKVLWQRIVGGKLVMPLTP